MTVTTRPTPFADLAASLDGELITPDSARYDELRQVFLGDVDPLPAAIARVANGVLDLATSSHQLAVGDRITFVCMRPNGDRTKRVDVILA